MLGFDDVLPAEVSTPGITTIRQPMKEMGLQAVKWALQALDARERGVRMKAQLHKAVPQLVTRTSTGAPPKHKTNVGNGR